MKCPVCHGKGTRSTVAESSGGFGKLVEWRTVRCSSCRGSGRITPEQFLWLTKAAQLRDLRVSIDLSVVEAALEYGTTVVAWNDAEHGRADPQPLIACMMRLGATA
jgi:hypothetical protein